MSGFAHRIAKPETANASGKLGRNRQKNRVLNDKQRSRGVVDKSTGPRLIVEARPTEDGDVCGRRKGKIPY